ncbi:SDR family oxidoreductase [Actinoplanes bogorensis]|uniref:SDR family oxidoreductase n=1 Tax=Paractinoplanes bogorensis TaxID=1610840 RepID=A0ABS5YJG1_9ACTN|nr:NAD(P)-binding oxidoreductase [Actinoplanes bogorensis]MBU2663611.1 SDR family oxidoreductase [Actinoplanes bogorensis]
MRIAVLGATGGVGRLLVRRALDRGLQVTAVARDPRAVAAHDGLIVAPGDVHDPGSIARAVEGSEVLLSGLGGPPGILVAGARAAVKSGVPRVIWLGAFGTGRTAAEVSGLTRAVLGLALRRELPDKVAADDTVLAAGFTVFHAGRLTNGPAAAGRTVAPSEVPRRLFPAAVSRATVAAAMVDEAVDPRFPGRIAVPGGAE